MVRTSWITSAVRVPTPNRVSMRAPGIILLDLNMPKKDGREALAEMKADADLRSIPVVVLTTSKDEQDVIRTYDLGVSSVHHQAGHVCGVGRSVAHVAALLVRAGGAARPPTPMMPPDTRVITVLLVEDDEDDYLITRDILTQQDRARFALDWCQDFATAVSMIAEQRHDVYLIDYRLGERTGLDLVRDSSVPTRSPGDHAHQPGRLRDRPGGSRPGRDGLPPQAGVGPPRARAVDPLRHESPAGAQGPGEK